MTGNEEKTSNRFPSANCVIVAAATVLSCPYYVYITITIDYYLDRYITKIDYIHRLHQIDNIYRLHRQITQIDYTRYITQIDYTRQITYIDYIDRLHQIYYIDRLHQIDYILDYTRQITLDYNCHRCRRSGTGQSLLHLDYYYHRQITYIDHTIQITLIDRLHTLWITQITLYYYYHSCRRYCTGLSLLPSIGRSQLTPHPIIIWNQLRPIFGRQ